MDEEYRNLLNNHPVNADFIKSITIHEGPNYFIPNLKAVLKNKDHFPESLFKELESFDVYKLPLEKYS
jgi:hypothetical protein